MGKHVLNKVATAMLPISMGLAAVQPLAAYAGRSSYLSYGRNSNRLLADQFSALNTSENGREAQAISTSNLLQTNAKIASAELAITKSTARAKEPLSVPVYDIELTQLNPVSELVIIDAAVPDKQTFYKKNKPGIEVVEIKYKQNGLTQLKNILKNYTDLKAIHLVSHADNGVIYLGETQVTEQLLRKEIKTLAALDVALKDGGDLLLYGCNLASGEKGEALLELIANQAHIDVAASNDLTGNNQLKGDWELEISTGSIESDQPFSQAALRDFTALLVASDGVKNFTGWTGTNTTTLSTTDFYLTGSDDQGAETINIYGSAAYMVEPGAATGAFMFLQADGTNTASFELTAMQFSEYGADQGVTNVFIKGYVSGGGTVTSSTLTGTGGTDTFSFGAGQLGTFSGQQLTGFKVYFDSNQVDYSQIDSFTITGALAPNTTPAISIDNTNLAFTENAAVTQIDAAATLSDADGDADWNGGTLVAQITANNEAADELSIPDNIVGTINTSGTNILNGATVIGTLSASEGAVTNGTALTITFNANATNALVQQVLRAIHYRNTSDTPGTANRTITFTATDTNSASAADTRTVTVSAVNDDPSNSGTLPTDIAVTEDVAGNFDISAVTLTDADAAASNVVVTHTASAGTLTATSGGSVTIGGSGTGTLTMTGSIANIDTYLNTVSNIQYTGASNVNGNDAASVAVKINDGGNTGSGGGTDIALGTVNMDITAVNDPPTNIVLSANSINQSATGVAANVGNLSTTDTEGGSFTYSLVANGASANGSCGAGNDANNASFQITTASFETVSALTSGSYKACVQTNDTGVTYQKTFTITVNDNVGPSISSVSIPNSAHKVGDTVTVTITVASDPDDYTTGGGGISGSIAGYTLGSLSKTNNTTYTATLTITDGGTDVAAGSNVPVSFTLTDSSTNTSSAFTTAISQASDAIYANLPDVNLTASSNTLAEDGGTSTLTGTLSGSLNNQWPVDVTVNLAYTGTGTITTDYTGAAAITIASGGSTGTTVVTSLADTIFDAAIAETIIVDINSLSVGNEGTTNQQTLSITDAESAPVTTLSVGNVSVAENGGTSSITAALDNATYENVTVNLSYSGTATLGGTDANTPSSSITILAGATSGSAVTGVTSIDDALGEGDETIIIDISSVSGGSATESGVQQQTVTITDDEDITAPTVSAVSIPNSAHKVGDTVTATITVTSDTDDYTTGAGGISGSIAGYALGSLSKTNNTTYTATFTITDGGTDVAAGSNVAVNFSIDDSTGNTSSAFTTAINQGSDAIYANVPDVDLTASTNTLAEDGGTSTLTGTLSGSLNNQWPVDVTVNLAYTGTGTITTDYTGASAITISSGSSTGTTVVTSLADTLFDAAIAETIIVDINSLSVGNEGTTNQQTLSITDAESAPVSTLSVGNASVAENGGTSSITATLDNATYENVTVNLSYSGTATLGGTDANTPSASITILAGATSGSAATGITSVDDALTEGVESIVIDIASVSGGSATENGVQQQTVNITDDDVPQVSLSVSSASIAEAAGTSTLTATLDQATFEAVTVTLSYSGSATNVTDYTGSNTITVLAGNTTGTLVLSAVQDALAEVDETIIVDITGVAGGTAIENGMQQQTVTITDDEVVNVSLSASPVTFNEVGGTSTISATLDQSTFADVTVSLAYTGTATDVTDYTGTGDITISAGQTTGTRVITGVADAAVEGDESIIVDISAVAGGSAVENGVQQQTLTITDTNSEPVIGSTPVTSVNEDSLYSYTFAATDVDTGDTLTLSATQLPGWLSFNSTTGVLSGTPTNTEVGTHNVTLRVNDGTVDVDQAFVITVVNTNDAPTGSVSITGNAIENQTLTADTSALADIDGLGTFSYQWNRGGTNVGTNSSSYTLASADISSTLTVTVSYTDGGGTLESITSAATATIVGAADTDNDGVPDSQDAFPDDPTETTDQDNDGVGDNADTDRDNDGVRNIHDAFPDDATEWQDIDGDGIGDNTDMVIDDTDGDGIPNPQDVDIDGDGVPNRVDAFPYDSSETSDLDGDGVGDNTDGDLDGDGIDNTLDTFVDDTDNDGIPNRDDLDIDGDGVLNKDDTFPVDEAENKDLDGDGVGDNADTDRDGDGIEDDSDTYPDDTDNDGIGNEQDSDDDNDGVADVIDDFPLNSAETLDTDEDGLGDNADADRDGDGIENTSDTYPDDFDNDEIVDLSDTDRDDDGVPDEEDAFPLNPAETGDIDGDGVGDSIDYDRDGDGIPNDLDANPDDTDNDNIVNDLDTDKDGDGVPDANDPFPLDVNESRDLDKDGFGDNVDTDLDGDGISNITEGTTQDADEDGIPDHLDADDTAGARHGGDSDGDGIPDLGECPKYPDCADRDNDGQPDYMDADHGVISDDVAPVTTNGSGLGSLNLFWLFSLSGVFLFRQKKLLLMIGLFCLSFSAGAETNQTDNEGSYYLGLGMGMSFLQPDITGTIFDVSDDQDMAVSVLLGHRFNSDWMLDLAFTDLGQAELSTLGNQVSSVKYQLINISAIYKVYDFNQQNYPLALHVKGGYAKVNSSSAVPIENSKSDNVNLGLFAQYTLPDEAKLRFGYDSYGEDAGFISVSIVLDFM